VSVVSLGLGVWQARENAEAARENAQAARESTELAKTGIELTREARVAEDEAARKGDAQRIKENMAKRAETVPYLSIEKETNTHTFIIWNDGLGPALIYQADFFAMGKWFTLRYGPEDSNPAMEDFIATAKGLYSPEKAVSTWTELRTPTRVIPAGGSVRFLSYGASPDDPQGNKFREFASKIGIRFCFANLVGDFAGSVENVPSEVNVPDCPDAPKAVDLSE
jgi:hypothetical protein